VCSKYANHSRFCSQHNLGDLCDHLNQHENLQFDDERNLHRNSERYKGNGYRHLELLIITFTTSGCKEKSI
jgi:hypothetical protein